MKCKENRKTCLAFGSFDGMHIGHQAVINEMGRQENFRKVLLSFEDKTNPILYSEKEKQHFLKAFPSVEIVTLPVEEYFTRTPEEFCREILCGKLSADRVVFGACHEKLDIFSRILKDSGVDVTVVPTVLSEGKTVSPDMVKDAVSRDDFARVKTLLGGSYIANGIVVHGKGVGRKFGLPTANLQMQENKIFPPYGVYGAQLLLDGKTYEAMTNVGIRPSDDDNPRPTVESYILDFDEDIYGKEVTVELKYFVRKIRKFPGGLKEVKQQVEKDIKTVKTMLEK